MVEGLSTLRCCGVAAHGRRVMCYMYNWHRRLQFWVSLHLTRILNVHFVSSFLQKVKWGRVGQAVGSCWQIRLPDVIVSASACKEL